MKTGINISFFGFVLYYWCEKLLVIRKNDLLVTVVSVVLDACMKYGEALMVKCICI